MVTAPIRKNARWFVFMYVLCAACAMIEVQSWEKVYSCLWLELFLDLYVVSAVLMLLPERWRRWVRGILAVLTWIVCVADVYCFVKFKTVLNPQVLMLVGETNARETGDFLSSLASGDVILSQLGWILLIGMVGVISCGFRFWVPRFKFKVPSFKFQVPGFKGIFKTVFSVVVCGLLSWSAVDAWPNKKALVRMAGLPTVGQVEHELTRKECFNQYVPPYRLWFSIRANQLAAQQISKLVTAADKVMVDSCSFTTPNIVLIIGESYGRHHSQQYGYKIPTTPRQLAMEISGRLVRFTDVVAPWNLTSFVFKNLFSMHVVGQDGEWCDYPLFPELFRKAGYHVTFLTNQFLPQAKQAVYDFSGGFFLNNPKLSEAQFDTRNERLHVFDAELIADYEQLREHEGEHNLTIFHLLGQHVNYRVRCPKKQMKFTADDYQELRPELSAKQRKMLAYYDNATLYNDSVVSEIVRRFDDRDAVVIYMPDHGEECYEGTRGFICRSHEARIDYDLARYEFEIPFWIYCSRKFQTNHPEVYQRIVQSRHRPLMTDALAHTLLFLGGISSADYHAEYDVLSDIYDEHRPRILKGTTNYDEIKKEAIK